MPLNGNRVAELRKTKGLTQQALGDALGISLVVLVDQLFASGVGLTPKLKKDLGSELTADIEAAYTKKTGLSPALRERIYWKGKVTQAQIARWERNETDVSGTAVSLLAIALDASTDHLLNLSPYVKLSLDKSKLRPDQARLVELNEAGTLPHEVRMLLSNTPTLSVDNDTTAENEPNDTDTLGEKKSSDRKVS
jgi:transcriptional regulator with XRE-family HTH domain